MKTQDEKLWYDYCKALNLNPYSIKVKQDEYHMKGFEEWKRLKREYRYYNQQFNALRYPVFN
tara:strand:- start:1775 stop:1960 length:186 start_codon:yes stop_codon:yes gene_type:complete